MENIIWKRERMLLSQRLKNIATTNTGFSGRILDHYIGFLFIAG